MYGGYQRDVYSNIGYVEKPPTVRAAMYLAPSGLGILLLAAVIASSGWVCLEQCLESAELLDERLLDCEESCKADMTNTLAHPDPSWCKDRCLRQVGFTASKVKSKEASCKRACAKSPAFMHLLAFVGTVAILAVTPLLGAYKGSCRCECCIGEGCSGRLALLNVAWFFYGFSCLWVLPSVLEDTSEVGGKVLFALAQGVAMTAMYVSRTMAEKAAVTVQGMPPNGVGPGGGELGTMVGAAVRGTGSANSDEVQQQIKALTEQASKIAEQVQELVRMQAEAKAREAQAPAPSPPSAPHIGSGTAPAPAPAAAPQDLM